MPGGQPSGDTWGSLAAFQQVSGEAPAPSRGAPALASGANASLLTPSEQAQAPELLARYDKDQKAARERKKAAAAEAAQTKATEAEIAAVNNSPWTKLGNALASQFQQAETPVAAAISGQGIGTAQEGAAGQALASLGLSPSSSAGQWLSSQTAAAQQTAAPVAQAMAQEGAQYRAEEGPISAALAAYGQANALEVQTAPESAWLNALASHITSNLSYQGVVPKAALSSFSPSVAEALQQSGGYIGTSGAGTVPVQDITKAPGGGSEALAGAGSSLTAGAGVIPGAVPSTSPAPGG